MQSLFVKEDITISDVLPAHTKKEGYLVVAVSMQFKFADNEEEFKRCQSSSSRCTKATSSDEEESGIEDNKEDNKEEELCPLVKRVYIKRGYHGLVYRLKHHWYD